MSRGQTAVDDDLPQLICEWCGMRIEDDEQQCMARADGGCAP